ncbi:MAG: hypothetical protein EP330_16785 [Deltaproteobacteria bacterium]|nr:MAG: hypothetical protein EP330_16785 [Deltaproteobacteria bacterium]
MRAIWVLALIAGCSDYDLTGEPPEQEAPIEETDDPPVVDETLDNPLAVCASDPSQVRPGLDPNTWVGENSSDPEGIGITEYRWTLVSAPTGSTAALAAGTGANRGFQADVAGVYQAELVVVTEDGRISAPCTASLTAGELQLPVAVCFSDPDTVRPPMQSNTWVGADSYDPEGRNLVDFRWSFVSAPAGSSATLGGSGPDRPFLADAAGTYQAQLVVVTDDNRESEPCVAELEAIPAEALWIEMYWETAEDIDLHLLEGNGRLHDAARDCHWRNCTAGLEWGVAGAGDNPSLDLDDTEGTGPENINITAPAAGTYTVVAHDWVGVHPVFGTPTDFDGVNQVTVNIYIDGLLEFTDTRPMEGEDAVIEFAEVDWPSATITPL